MAVLLTRRRAMPTSVKDGAVQRAAGGEEQGDVEGIWEVLSSSQGCCTWSRYIDKQLATTMAVKAVELPPLHT